ncbi:hypothetical protein KCU71_g1448, partial [Aureobasidium melanogenum]
MSAEDLGTRELAQVRSQRLDELLTTLRLLHDPSSNSKLGIPALDKLLATHTTRFDPTNLSGIPAPPIIEITSPAPKSGKTEFLYWVIANLVLGGGGLDQPEGVTADHADDSVGDGTGTTSGHTGDHEKPSADVDIARDETEHIDATIPQTTDQPDQPHNNSTPQTNQPKQSNQTTPKAVALLSTSPINVPRLSQILLHHLLTLRPTLSPTEAQPLIITALSHIHIYQPTSISSLLATVSSLPSYFFSTSNTSKDRRLGGIFISTPSAYFWEDKVQVVTSAATSASASASKTGKFAALAMVLRRVGAVLQTPVFYTTSHLSASSASSSSTDPVTWALPPALASPFSTLPTLRLIISRGAIKGFSKEVDAETAFRQREARATATRNSNFRVRVNQWGNELQRNTGFEVKIDASGVRIL